LEGSVRTIPLRETDMAGVLKAIRPRVRTDFHSSSGSRGAGSMRGRFQKIPIPSSQYRVAVVARSMSSLPISFPNPAAVLRHASDSSRHGADRVLIGSMLSRSLRALADETDRIQRSSRSHAAGASMIREIDDLGHSVSTMRTLVQTFSNFVQRLVQHSWKTGDAMDAGGARRKSPSCLPDVVNFTGITDNRDPTQVCNTPPLLRGLVRGDHGQQGHGRQISAMP